MRKLNIDFNKAFKKVLIGYIAIFLIGIVIACVFGVKLDINFKGGSKVSYSYQNEIDTKAVEKVIKESIKESFTLTKSEALNDGTKQIEIALTGKKALTPEELADLNEALNKSFEGNSFEYLTSNSVSPTMASTFFIKSLAAVVITAIFVVLYVGIRFRKIGGVSAAITALVALVFDLLITFFVCVIFRLQIDSNYIAVALTMLGYSLNDTIVIYDRVRENRRIYGDKEIGEVVNISINQTLVRNVVTTVTTFLAIVTIIVVSEIYGLQTLRTFAIPMAFGLVSGGISSVFVAGPLWVVWKKFRATKAK